MANNGAPDITMFLLAAIASAPLWLILLWAVSSFVVDVLTDPIYAAFVAIVAVLIFAATR